LTGPECGKGVILRYIFTFQQGEIIGAATQRGGRLNHPHFELNDYIPRDLP